MRSTTVIFFVLSVVAVINGLPFDINNGNLDQQAPVNRDVLSCSAWYALQGDPQKLLAQTLKPPCKISTPFPLTLSGGWTVDSECDSRKQPNTCSLHQGAYGCYRSALKPTGPGGQACYDINGNWISDPWKGAGTVDAESPTGSFSQDIAHFFADVAPYYSCCSTFLSPQPFTCNLYYQKRPPGQCVN